MDKLRIHVPHEERNDRLPWAYREARERRHGDRAGDPWILVMMGLCALFLLITYGLWRIFR